MKRKITTHRTGLTILKEVFESRKEPFPYDHSFSKEILPEGEGWSISFEDGEENRFKVLFQNVEENNQILPGKQFFNVGFEVNDSQGREIDPKNFQYYLKVLATVFDITEQFISKFKPERLVILPVDPISEKMEQKKRIYSTFIQQKISKGGYKMDYIDIFGQQAFLLELK